MTGKRIFFFDKTTRYFGWKFGFDGKWLNFVGNITGIKNPSVQFDVNRFIDEIQINKDFKAMCLSKRGWRRLINSKRKGAKGELEFAKLCSEYGFDSRRTQQYCGNTGDAADIVGLPGIHVEVKRVEALNINKAMEQSERDAYQKGDNEIPIVAHRKNRAGWLITMKARDWLSMFTKTKSVSDATKVCGEKVKKNDTH